MDLFDFDNLAGNYRIVFLDGNEKRIDNALISNGKNNSLVTFL